jgi:tetratricopeptide (TPR) repeat protein
VTVQDAINLALQNHRAGKLADAEAVYRQILAQHPIHAEALHLLGVLVGQTGRHAEALQLIDRAVALEPNLADYLGSRGLTLTALGRLDEAIAAYQQAITLQPHLAQAHNNLAIVLAAKGDIPRAIEFARKAVALGPNTADFHFNLGNFLKGTGHLDEAIDSFRRAIQLSPRSPPAYNNLGAAYRRQGRLDDAIVCYQMAVEIQPDYLDALSNLGEALCRKGRFDQAIAACRRVISLRPDSPDALNTLGIALAGGRNWEAAINAFRLAIAQRPNFAQAHDNLGNAFFRQGKVRHAIDSHRAALAIDATSADALNNLGAALMEIGQLDDAERALSRALELHPGFLDAQINLGNAFCRLGRIDQSLSILRSARSLKPDSFDASLGLANALTAGRELDEADALYRSVLAMRPVDPLAHSNLGYLLLLRGDFERGWPEAQWHYRLTDKPARPIPQCPQWDGTDLAGRRILLRADQGFGDCIQFARYIPMVAQPGAKITLACYPELHRLLKNSAPGVCQAIDQWLLPENPLNAFDVQCPLPLLPGVFKTTLQTIPSATPYLTPDPADVQHWRKRIGEHSRFKVGLAWSGRPEFIHYRTRSVPVEKFAPLMQLPNVRLFSLQKAKSAEHENRAKIQIIDWTDELDDFADTAALLANLDLLITSDTAVAHLAGAMGKPVWLLLPFVPDWRWMLDRADSPWYPTMRLFRQPKSGDWDTPIHEAAEALTAAAASGICQSAGGSRSGESGQ